jgi:inorganic pyrophosphatase
MADYNQIVQPGDVAQGAVNTVVEISEGSMLKIEYRRDKAVFELDRVEPSIFAKPTNYGFIPQTLDEDGDELDTLIICSEPLPTGVVVNGRIIGVMNFEDDGDMDHKIVIVPADDRNTGDAITTLDDVPEQWKKKVEHHFNHYKDLKKPGSTKVLGWGDIEAAKQVINESIERWNQQV